MVGLKMSVVPRFPLHVFERIGKQLLKLQLLKCSVCRANPLLRKEALVGLISNVHQHPQSLAQ